MVVLGLTLPLGVSVTEIDVMAANLAMSQPCSRSRDGNDVSHPYAGVL